MAKYLVSIIISLILAIAGYLIGYNNGREKEILASRSEIDSLQKELASTQLAEASPPVAPEEKTAAVEPESQEPTENGTANKTTTEKAEPQGEFTQYAVQDKDTLFIIGLKFDLTWEKIAAANGLEENSPLYIGQKLKIPNPDAEGTQGNALKTLEINLEEATNQQKEVNEKGTDLWRRDPVEVVRKEAPTELNLLPGDPFSILNKDSSKGIASVFLQKDKTSYTFSLIQPVDKGDNGIWKIEKIETKVNE